MLPKGIKIQNSIAISGGHYRYSWSPTGSWLAVPSELGVISVVDVAAEKIVREFPVDAPMVTVAIWSPDGETLAYASSDIWLVHLLSGRKRRIDSGHKHSIWSLAWSPDGKSLAAGSFDRTVSVHTLDGTETSALLGRGTYSPPRRFVGHRGEVTCVGWSPDGSRLASCSTDRMVRILDLSTGSTRHVLTGHAGPDTSRLI
jgi:WD40 repeat protein